MGELSEELTLDVTPALAAVDDVEAALVAAIASFGEGLAEQIQSVDVSPVADAFATIDVSSVREGLEAEAAAGGQSITEAVEAGAAAAQPSVAITDVDASSVTSEIDAAAAAADTRIELEAEVNVSGLEETAAGLEGLAPAAQEAGSALDSTGSSATITATAMALLPKGAKAAQTGIAGLVKTAGPAGAVIGTAAAAVGFVTSSALEADEASARFGKTFGTLGGEIEKVDIAGLNTDLGSLALQTGSSDDQLRQALASLGQLGDASDSAGPQVRQTAEEVLVLSNYLAATNPQLGSADEIVSSLTGALARGGRAAQGLGLNLSSAEVQARAAQIAQADLRTEVTQFDKVAAGAAITIERLGPGIREGIEDGSKNATVATRSLKEEFGELTEELGKPFVAPAKAAITGLTGVLHALQVEIGDTNTSVTDAALKSFPLLGDALRGGELFVGLRGLTAEWTNNQEATLAALEAQARLPGPMAEVAQKALDQRDAVLERNAAQREAVEADTASQAALAAFGLSVDALAGKEVNFQALQTAQTEMAAAFTSSIPTVSASLGQLADDTEININKIIEDFRKQNEAFAHFLPNLQTIIAKGGADLALSIEALGPEQGAAFAAAVASSTPAQIAALESQSDRRNLFLQGSGTESGNLLSSALAAGATSTPALQGVFSAGQRVGERGVKGVGEGSKGAQSIGEGIGEGVARGIESKGPRGASAAERFGLKVRRALEDFFRLGSPSRLTYGFGGDIGEGLALGILSSRRQVELAARSLASSVALPALSAAVPAAAPGTSQGASEAGVAGTSGTSIGELHVHEAPDPRGTLFRVSTEIARESQR